MGHGGAFQQHGSGGGKPPTPPRNPLRCLGAAARRRSLQRKTRPRAADSPVVDVLEIGCRTGRMADVQPRRRDGVWPSLLRSSRADLARPSCGPCRSNRSTWSGCASSVTSTCSWPPSSACADDRGDEGIAGSLIGCAARGGDRSSRLGSAGRRRRSEARLDAVLGLHASTVTCDSLETVASVRSKPAAEHVRCRPRSPRRR